MAIGVRDLSIFFPPDTSIADPKWRPAQSYAIQLDGPRETWHAGHVSALLSDGTYVIAGAQTGGLWLLTPSIEPSYRDGHRAAPLSNDWESPDVSSLAWGPDGSTQVYVGPANSAVIYLLEFRRGVGELNLERTTVIPLPVTTTVFAIAVVGELPATRRGNGHIALATSTGVLWSELPDPLNEADQYHWQFARGLPGGAISGLAPAGWSGSGRVEIAAQNVAAALYGTLTTGGGLYLGAWNGGQLVFSASSIQGVSPGAMRRTSLASCTDHPNRVYAISAASDGTILAVLGSDGGSTWKVLGSPSNWTYAGLSGDWNQCIAVSQHNPEVVAIGWQAGGPYFTTDGGNTWQHPKTDDAKGGVPGDANLHGDLHALYFGSSPAAENDLYVGGDGGIAHSRDLGSTWDSQFSRPLNNLQIYGIKDSEQNGLSYRLDDGPGGCLAASSRFPGLLVCGTQDNGNLFLAAKQEAGLAWQSTGLPISDGGLCLLVDSIGGLIQQSNVAPQALLSLWDDVNQRFSATSVIPVEGNASGASMSGLAVVSEPPVTVRGFLYACAGDANGTVYGFFALPIWPLSKFWFGTITNVGSEIVGLASLDGQTIITGTVDGRVLRVDAATGSATSDTLPPQEPGPGGTYMVSRIDTGQIERDQESIVRRNRVHIYALRGGTILHFDGVSWSALPGSEWLTFAVDWPTGRLFAADQASVSEFDGATWRRVATGLPVYSHCTDLRIAANGEGGRDLFLATYGRSVWRATIELPSTRPPVPHLPPLAAEVLLAAIQDGGGLVRIGNQFVVIPPRPLDRDLLTGVALHDLARGMSTHAGRTIQHAVLEQIAAAISRELESME